MNGVGYKTELAKFISAINKDPTRIKQLLLDDPVSNSRINHLLYDINTNAEAIFKTLFIDVDKGHLDWITTSYLAKSFGIPNSLGNIEYYHSARKTIDDLNTSIGGLKKRIDENVDRVENTELYSKYIQHKSKSIIDFDSLVSLQEYLSTANILELINLFEIDKVIRAAKKKLFKQIKDKE